MARLEDIVASARQCENLFYNMCKIRTKELRDCVLPRCCSICDKAMHCEGICIPLRDMDHEEIE